MIMIIDSPFPRFSELQILVWRRQVLRIGTWDGELGIVDGDVLAFLSSLVVHLRLALMAFEPLQSSFLIGTIFQDFLFIT